VIGVLKAAPVQAATQLGIFGNLARFQSLTGQRSQVGHVIVAWNQRTFDQLWPRLGPTPMLGFDTGEDAITPEGIARGAGDGFLLAMSASARGLGRPVYICPMGEMNGRSNAYSAYNANGSQRDSAHSTAAFRKAFSRISLIMHGGPTVSAGLRQLGLPPLATAVPAILSSRSSGTRRATGARMSRVTARRRTTRATGNVDVVGDDLYDIGRRAEWPAAEALYKAHPRKPFAFPEWSLWESTIPLSSSTWRGS
jgi:hypothetical protein